MVLADDSGLEVEALGGAPGVYSARYAERERFANPHGLPVDACNNLCLLERMDWVQERAARYRCVLVGHGGRTYRLADLMAGLSPADLQAIEATAPRSGQATWDEVVRRWPALAEVPSKACC